MASSLQFSDPAGKRVDLLVIAGEHSGDQHAAAMVRGFLQLNPSAQVAAIGGPELRASGVQLLHDLTATSVIGFVEVLSHARYFKSVFDATLRWIEKNRPAAVCFVDYPGFNLRLAKALKARGLSVRGGGSIKTLYYISPQIWAWKARRRFEMEECLDALAVIFPFEVACFSDTKLPVSFVGHPFITEGHEAPVRYDPEGPVLLLPGSRKQAVKRIFPVMLKAYALMKSKRPAVVLYPSDTIHSVLLAEKPPEGVSLQRTGETLAASAVLTSSGTMSMHCALAGIPGAVVYRTNPLTYLLARILVKTRFIGIANLLLKAAMYPEYIQGAAKATALSAELQSCLNDPERRARTALQAEQLRRILKQSSAGTVSDWLAYQLLQVAPPPHRP
jgi:lipid-A-disaccharide synthase